MDLTAAACNLQQARIFNEVQTRVAKKILDTQRSNGAAAVQLLEAATGHTAAAGNALVAAATGLGGEVDTVG